MKKQILAFVLAIVLPHLGFAQGIMARVINVHDGDTFTAIDIETSQKYKVRLLGVDTPEVDFFQETQGESAQLARQALEQLIPPSSVVELQSDSEIDKHGRILGQVFKEGVDINHEMLLQGWGFFYFIYPFEKRMVSQYSEAAKEAVESQRGLFALDQQVEEPYLFRMRVKKMTGKNYIGDLETKQLFDPDQVFEVPVWRRVFFSDFETATQLGYH